MDHLHCPQCGCKFALSKLMRDALEAQVRAELQPELEQRLAAAAQAADERTRRASEQLEAARAKVAEAAKREADLLRRQRELEDREREAALHVERKVAEESAKIRRQEAERARERVEREAEARLREKDAELAKATSRLAEAASREAMLMRKQREIEDRAAELSLEVEKRLAEELRRVREHDARGAAERAERDREALRLREEEHRRTIEGMQRHIDELQRKIIQGSQQTQGEAQEVALRNLLSQAFAADDVEDVPKGLLGADLVQRVRAPDGRDCGAIVWESKRTKSWSNDWLPKLRDDQRSAGAAVSVLVTQALPAGVSHFALVEGVWICAWPYATALASALRAGMIEVTRARCAAEGRGEKMQLLFAYLTGPEFTNRIGGVVESLAEMHQDLEREKRAMVSLWKRRERQLERARNNVAAFYGEVQGISGRQLEDLPALSLEAPADAPAHAEARGALPSGVVRDEDATPPPGPTRRRKRATDAIGSLFGDDESSYDAA